MQKIIHFYKRGYKIQNILLVCKFASTYTSVQFAVMEMLAIKAAYSIFDGQFRKSVFKRYVLKKDITFMMVKYFMV